MQGDPSQDDFLDKFLLKTAHGGAVAKPLHEMRAFFAAPLTMAAKDHEKLQELMIGFCELFTVLMGLLTPIPLAFLDTSSIKQGKWLKPDSSVAFKNGLAVLVYCCTVFSLLCSFLCGLTLTLTGWKAKARVYAEAISFMTLGMVFGVSGLVLSAVCIFWHLSHISNLAVTMATLTIWVVGFAFWLIRQLVQFLSKEMPLELYHLPRWFKVFLACFYPPLVMRLWSGELLEDAKERAKELERIAR